jgi:hypothetical protein
MAWSRLRFAVILLTILAACSSGRGEEMVPIGRVLDLKGDWHLYPFGADESAARALQKWQDVTAKGVIRSQSPDPADHISIVDSELKILVARNCRVVATCYQPIILPAPPQRGGLTKETLAIVESVWASLWSESYQQSMHRVRGTTGRMGEGVVPIVDGELDLADSMAGMRSGKYILAPHDLSAVIAGTGGGIDFDWKPANTKIVRVGDHKPGLYDIVPAAMVDTLYQSKGPSVRLLICKMRQCPDALASFQRAQTAAAKWEGAAGEATVHQFLRAFLTELAKTVAAPK